MSIQLHFSLLVVIKSTSCIGKTDGYETFNKLSVIELPFTAKTHEILKYAQDLQPFQTKWLRYGRW